MSAKPPPSPRVPDSAEALRPIVDSEIHRLLQLGVGIRAGAAPFLMAVAALVIWVDPELWRQALLVVLAAVAFLGAWISARRIRRMGVTSQALVVNFTVMAVLQVLMIGATGGLDSPMLPVTLPLAILGGVVLGRSTTLAALLGLQVLGLGGLLVGELLGLWPNLRLAVFDTGGPESGLELGTRGVVMMGLLLGGGTLGTVVRDAFEHMVMDALAAREAQLRTLVGHTQDLETLSGEIAHELKNPLASIKGLGALLARDVPEGRASERLAVMRGEVDRMQGIIEEFLTFSRPLSPLALESVDPDALCRRVASLHEAEGLKRQVGLAVSGGGPLLKGDPRKLSQVLVNLVQNALDVAPTGSLVELSTRAGPGDTVWFEVSDRGAGLPAELGDRVFHPGVSAKAQGSGLGLTIALGLARQHGGELVLEDRHGGGTVARLSLPCGGPP